MSTIECEICNFQYNEEERTPRILTSCGHTICQQCAIRLSEDDQSITCPFDRRTTLLDRNEGVDGLPKNFALLDLWRKANQEGQEKNSGVEADVPCFENPSHEAVFYCQQCEVELCESCFTSAHKLKYLSAHQKINISEKPIKLPKCPKHPHNVAEFLCTDPSCTIPTKTMCQTCVLFDLHKSHEHDFLMEKLQENEQLLKNLLITNEQHQRDGEKIIEKTKRNLESFDESGSAFEDVARRISDDYDMRKIEALRILSAFVNDAKKKQTTWKIRLEKEYSESVKRKELIEKKLKMKNDLQNTDEITCLKSSHWSKFSSLDELDGLLDYEFIVPNMRLQIINKPKD